MTTSHATLSRLAEDMADIKKLLLGDEYTDGGLIHRLNEVDRRLAHLERLLDRSRYALIGLLLFACSGVYENVKKLIDALEL